MRIQPIASQTDARGDLFSSFSLTRVPCLDGGGQPISVAHLKRLLNAPLALAARIRGMKVCRAICRVMGRQDKTGFMDATKDYIAGLAAGVATVLIGHPFDTVKVKLQTQNTDAHSQRFNVVKFFHQPKGLYRGATSSFVGVSIESAVLFGAYSQIKARLQASRCGGMDGIVDMRLAFMFAEREMNYRMGRHHCTSLFLQQVLLELVLVSSCALLNLSRLMDCFGEGQPQLCGRHVGTCCFLPLMRQHATTCSHPLASIQTVPRHPKQMRLFLLNPWWPTHCWRQESASLLVF